RARAIASAINSRFPRGPGDRKPTAIPRNEERIEINIPRRHQGDPVEFAQLLLHTRVTPGAAQEWAVRYVRALREQPELTQELAWRLRALGEAALPQVRTLYDYAEAAPRFAALEIGAAMGDPLAGPALLDIAQRGPDSLRLRAIELLGKLDPDPQINQALLDLLDDEALDVRVTAYEALLARGDVRIHSTPVENTFRLDVVPAKETMIYITQQGTPRVVVFGNEPALKRPLFIAAWNDRLMLTADSPDDAVRLFYRDAATGRTTTTTVSPRLDELAYFLAHTPTPESPEPGLGLSYSMVVGALHAIWREGGYDGAFVAEQDKLAAEILRASEGASPPARPEGNERQTEDQPPATQPPAARPEGG
ncbi:MAG: hypothetical protein D6824_07365, partial [Planctomycetota bacterium]